MPEKLKNSRLAFLYLWITRAKYTMGIFFAFFAILYLFFGLVAVPQPVTMDFATCVEMMIACFLIGVAQQALAPVEKLSKIRCTLWVLCSGVISLIFVLVFGWFAEFPLWCAILFVAMFVLGAMFLLVSYYLELHYETRKLNEQLEWFQGSTGKTFPKNKKEN